MLSELILITLNIITIVVVIVLVLLAIAILIVVLAFSARKRREHEARVRERMLEMEGEAKFEAAADRVPVSRDPAEVAHHIAGLLQEHLSVRVLAVYAGQEADAILIDVSGSVSTDEPSVGTSLLSSVPVSLLTEHSRPAVVRRSVVASRVTAAFPVTEEPANEPGALASRESDTFAPPDLSPESSVLSPHSSVVNSVSSALDPEPSVVSPAEPDHNWPGAAVSASAGRGSEPVLLLPWHGAFKWQGLIVGAVPAAFKADGLDQYTAALARLTDRLALALEFELSDDAIDAVDERASRTTEFSLSLIASLGKESPNDAIVREVTTLIGSDSAALWRLDPGGGMVRMIASYGLKSPEFLPLPVGQGLAGSIAQSSETIAIGDASADPRCLFPREALESGVVAYLGAALVADNNVMGVIEVHRASNHAWEESDRRMLETAATLISGFIKATDSGGSRLGVESAYLGLSEALQRLRSPDEVKEAVVEVLGHALAASRVVVVEFNAGGQAEPVRHEYREPSAKSALGATFEESLVAKVVSSSGTEPIAIDRSQELSLMGAEMAESLDVISEMAVPVSIEGTTCAAVYVHQGQPGREWERGEIEFAERVVRQLSLSLSNLSSRDSALSDAQQAREEARRASQGGGLAKSMLIALPEMVFGLDREGNLNFFNKAAANVRGLKSEDLGRPAPVLTNPANPIWEKIVACETALRYEAEMRLQPIANSETVPVSISAAPLLDEKGEIAGRLIVVSDLSHLKSNDAAQRIPQLEQKLQSIERVLAQSREMEEQARAMLAKTSSLAAKARAEADESQRAQAEATQQLERAQEENKQLQGASSQLLDVNKLKSEFIVNAGHEIEASLQSVLGLAELLEQGNYGTLTTEQREAVTGIYGWARRMKSDVDWLIEYGSTRSRRLESTGGG